MIAHSLTSKLVRKGSALFKNFRHKSYHIHITTIHQDRNVKTPSRSVPSSFLTKTKREGVLTFLIPYQGIGSPALVLTLRNPLALLMKTTHWFFRPMWASRSFSWLVPAPSGASCWKTSPWWALAKWSLPTWTPSKSPTSTDNSSSGHGTLTSSSLRLRHRSSPKWTQGSR